MLKFFITTREKNLISIYNYSSLQTIENIAIPFIGPLPIGLDA